jgi:hypothetical protein
VSITSGKSIKPARRDIALKIERQVVEQRDIERGRGRDEQQRVAVGRRIDHGLDGDIGAGARLVLDDDRLTEPLRQPRRHDAGDDVAAAARRKSDHPP